MRTRLRSVYVQGLGIEIADVRMFHAPIVRTMQWLHRGDPMRLSDDGLVIRPQMPAIPGILGIGPDICIASHAPHDRSRNTFTITSITCTLDTDSSSLNRSSAASSPKWPAAPPLGPSADARA